MDKEVKEKSKKAHNADIEDDWDEYESDWKILFLISYFQ